MQKRNYSSVIWIILIVALCESCAFSKNQQMKLTLEEVKTDIENPIAIVPVEKPANDISPVKYIIRTSDKLLFCDENYEPVNMRIVQPDWKTEMILSKKCQYILINETLSSPNEKGDVGKILLTLLDYKGNQYWSKEKTTYWDMMGTGERAISDANGNLFDFDKTNAQLRIIDKTGSTKKKFKFFEDQPVMSETGDMDISKNGEYIIILINKKHAERERTATRIPVRSPNKGRTIRKHIIKQDGEPHIFLFNKDGELLYKIKEDEEESCKILISDDGGIIICSLRDFDKPSDEDLVTKIYNREFDLIGSLMPYPRGVIIKKNRIIISRRKPGTKKYLISAYNMETLNNLWSTELSNTAISISNMTVNDIDLIKVVTQKGPTFTKPYSEFKSFLIDYNGAILDSIELGNINTSISGSDYTDKLIIDSPNYIFDGKIFKLNAIKK